MTVKEEILIPIYNSILGHKKKIKGRNNSFELKKNVFKKTQTRIFGDNNTIEIGVGSKLLNTNIVIRGNNHKIIIGDYCIIKNTELWIEDENCEISIGDKTTIEGAHIAVTEPNSAINLGNDCMLSSGIDIRNGDSHSIIDVSTSKRINFAKDITIGDHVWIGARVQILKGVNIGSNSIIGIRSLVTKDIPLNCVAVGMPAKVVKDKVTWDRKRIYDVNLNRSLR